MRTTLTSLLLLFLAASVSSAQDLDWKKLVERGEYTKLADKLEPYLDSSKADEKLRFYLDATLGYLRRGAKAKISGSEIVLVRGAKNDRLYQMPQATGRKRKDNHEGLFEDLDATEADYGSPSPHDTNVMLAAFDDATEVQKG